MTKFSVIAAALVLFGAFPAYALQPHTQPEGLYTHQIAHIFFAGSMLSLALRLSRSRLVEKASWHAISVGAWLFVLWNALTFAGHLLALQIPGSDIVVMETERVPYLHIQTWQEAVYYLLTMDHVICVPALLMFYFGLRFLRAERRQPRLPLEES